MSEALAPGFLHRDFLCPPRARADCTESARLAADYATATRHANQSNLLGNDDDDEEQRVVAKACENRASRPVSSCFASFDPPASGSSVELVLSARAFRPRVARSMKVAGRLKSILPISIQALLPSLITQDSTLRSIDRSMAANVVCEFSWNGIFAERRRTFPLSLRASPTPAII